VLTVDHRAVTESVSGRAKATDRAIDTVQHRLVVDVDGAGVHSVGDALAAGEIGRYDGRHQPILRRSKNSPLREPPVNAFAPLAIVSTTIRSTLAA
jgi:hypothetical protein